MISQTTFVASASNSTQNIYRQRSEFHCIFQTKCEQKLDFSTTKNAAIKIIQSNMKCRNDSLSFLFSFLADDHKNGNNKYEQNINRDFYSSIFTKQLH